MKRFFLFTLLAIAANMYAYQVSDSLYIGPSDRVANLIMSTKDYDDWIANDGFQTSNKSREITKCLYKYFKDDFDCIMLITKEEKCPPTIGYYGINRTISNEVQGIGISTYNSASYFGSEGKLMSLMYLPYVDAIKWGPTLHEFCHCWANFAIPSVVDGHWGICGGNTKGQLGGFEQSTLQTNVDGNANKYSVGSFGTNANGGNGVPYNEMELYLMGMLPIDSVQEFDAFLDVPTTSFMTDPKDESRIVFTAGERIHYTQQRIIDSLGVRVPNYKDSQKSFRTLFVILSKAPLTEAEWKEYDANIGWFCQTSDDGLPWLYNFWEATRGVGSINPNNLSYALKAGADIRDAKPILPIWIEGRRVICEGTMRIIDQQGTDVTSLNGNLPFGIYVVQTAHGSTTILIK